MSLLRWFRRLYSLDTLDTRFTASAESRKEARASANGGPPIPRWRTPEFFFYYFIFITVVPLMFKTVIDVSQKSHPTYKTYSHLLSQGWIPGRQVDNSDAQYASFRDNIPYLFLLLVAHPLARRLYDGLLGSKTEPTGADAADERLQRRTCFDYCFALLFITALHGVSAVKVLFILYLNYQICKGLPRQHVPAATWIFNISILFANELCAGYPVERVARMLVGVVTSSGQEPALVLWARRIDSLGGLMPRWEVLFKVTILRLISFNMDYYWSLDYPAASPIEKQLDPASLSDRDRVRIPAEHAEYNPRNYVAYVLYAPLYLAGPILTFNDYICQQRHAPRSVTRTRTTLYGIRFFLTVLCMELILHYIYAVAISKASPDWSLYTPAQLSMLAYFNLHIIWLKLLIPWRFFRFWALLDGVDPPENMIRCMSNNYSAFAFWRAWHRSFNRWVVRYLYVPLGGGGGGAGGGAARTRTQGPSGGLSSPASSSGWTSKTGRIFNTLVVFTFVALWHDINLRLLMWGWLVTLFVLPEVVATLLFPARKWHSQPTAYRMLCGVGAVGNILMMMMANLVGFALGLDGLKGLLEGIAGSYSGVMYLVAACAALFVGVQMMFEIREEEMRQGIYLKC